MKLNYKRIDDFICRYSYCWNNPLKYTDPSGFAINASYSYSLVETFNAARNYMKAKLLGDLSNYYWVYSDSKWVMPDITAEHPIDRAKRISDRLLNPHTVVVTRTKSFVSYPKFGSPSISTETTTSTYSYIDFGGDGGPGDRGMSHKSGFSHTLNRPKPSSNTNITSQVAQSPFNLNNFLSTTATSFNVVGYSSTAFGITQLGLKNNYLSTPISLRIGTFSSFSKKYLAFGILTKWSGRIGYLGTGLTIVSDYNAYQNNQIGGSRFAYRTFGNLGALGTGLAIGTTAGGPAGAIAGGILGGLVWSGEWLYDGTVRGLRDASSFFGNIEYQLSSGQWAPSF